MGCICSKGGSGRHGTDCVERESFRSIKSRDSHRGQNVFDDDVENHNNGACAQLIPTKSFTHDNAGNSKFIAVKEASDNVEKKPLVSAAINHPHLHINAYDGLPLPDIVQVPKIVSPLPCDDADALGMDLWPPWLSAVAGEAIRGWSPRKAESFEKLEKIGQGTYSSVYRARDLERGKFVALKKVRFANMDPESVRFMAREIIVLRRLDHPNIMKLECLIASKSSCSLYLVFQYMEHDLLGLQAAPGVKFTEAQIKCFMRQLLCGLDHCHSRGVLHRDIKGANLLIDGKGNLKIGDFGLATIFNPRKHQPLTSRVVTLWYRPPELLLGSSQYGPAVDLWSAGCILAELFTGKPIMPGRTEVEQLHKIFKLCGSPSEEYWRTSKLPHATIFKPQQPYRRCVSETFKDLPPSALALLEVLLATDPKSRGTASDALRSEFFSTEPLPCDPSNLPKYPPSKELDSKLKNEQAKGRGGDTGRRYGQEADGRQRPSENKALPVQYGNNKFQQRQTHRKTNSGKDNFAIEPPTDVPNYSLFKNASLSIQPEPFGSPRTVSEKRRVSRPNHKNVLDLRSQRSFMVRGAPQFSFVGVHESSQSQSSGESFNPTSSLLETETTQHLLDELDSSHQNGQHHIRKEQTGYDAQKKRIHCSGPLLPLKGNTDDMLREHEKQVQNAIRRTRNGKIKTTRFNRGDNDLGESLLHNA